MNSLSSTSHEDSPPPFARKRNGGGLLGMSCCRHALCRYVVPLLLIVCGSIALSTTGADLLFERLVYSHTAGWAAGEGWFWKLLYHAGTWPALVVTLLAVLGLWQPMRRLLPRVGVHEAAYLVLVVAVGPGLIANAVLKDHWGRPRPRDLVEFGGEFRYEPPMVRHVDTAGKSFPCGHATMGFFFFSMFFINGARGRRAWAWFAVAMALGWLIGFARALQGAHFLTDVWWAGGLMWMTCAALWDALEYARQRGLHAAVAGCIQRSPRWAGALVFPLGAALCGGVLLASPWQQNLDFTTPAVAHDRGLNFVAALQSGHVTLREGAGVKMVGEAYGHGSPGAGLRAGVKSWVDASGWQLRIRQDRDGWLTECNQQTAVELPLLNVADAYMDLSGTRLDLSLSAPTAGAEWTLAGTAGTVTVHVPAGLRVSLSNRSGIEVRDETGGWFAHGAAALHKGGEGGEVRIKITLQRGVVKLVRGSAS